MDRHVPHEERMQRVEEVMRELGLKKCEKTLIGVQGRIKGISGKLNIFLWIAQKFVPVSQIFVTFLENTNSQFWC